MQQSSPQKELQRRISAGLALVLFLGTFMTPALARAEVMMPAVRQDSPSMLLIAMADPPAFLAPAPTGSVAAEEKVREKEKEGAITPFIGSNPALTLRPPPERPAIAASDVIRLERPEVTAGVNVDLGAVKFNLGYTLPSGQVEEFVRPFGVNLAPGPDVKRFSLGVKIPF